VELDRVPNITSLPELDPVPDRLDLPILLKVGDNISTDEILPAGAGVLPFRSNVPRIAEFAFDPIDGEYAERARALRDGGGHILVAGANYGQGSSREHAALAPRYLGLRAVLAVSFARIHQQNLITYGVLPVDPADYERIEPGDRLLIDDIERRLGEGRDLEVENRTRGQVLRVSHGLSSRQVDLLLAGGVINWMRARLANPLAGAVGPFVLVAEGAHGRAAAVCCCGSGLAPESSPASAANSASLARPRRRAMDSPRRWRHGRRWSRAPPFAALRARRGARCRRARWSAWSDLRTRPAFCAQ
jgi:3-isopropylmalate dehydratase small subunit